MSNDGQKKPDTKAEELQDEALDEAQGGANKPAASAKQPDRLGNFEIQDLM
jgi:hypothetical protein